MESKSSLATVLFTDIVDSTGRAVELGDRGWRDLLQKHHALVRREFRASKDTRSRPPATAF